LINTNININENFSLVYCDDLYWKKFPSLYPSINTGIKNSIGKTIKSGSSWKEDYVITKMLANPIMTQLKVHKEKNTRKSKAEACLYVAVSSTIFTYKNHEPEVCEGYLGLSKKGISEKWKNKKYVGTQFDERIWNAKDGDKKHQRLHWQVAEYNKQCEIAW